jgi:hypothetical protein
VAVGDGALVAGSVLHAALEHLDGFPQDASFEEAAELVEGLTTPRPEALQSLLAGCTSVKVKRMFLFVADRAKHPWRANATRAVPRQRSASSLP